MIIGILPAHGLMVRKWLRPARPRAAPSSLRMAVDEADREVMREALALAARAGPGRTFPNPSVGCVVVGRDGTVCGRGWHPRAGWPHAEVYALADVTGMLPEASRAAHLPPAASALSDSEEHGGNGGNGGDTALLTRYLREGAGAFDGAAAGATAYVTLEPCSHAKGDHGAKGAAAGQRKSTPPCASTLVAAGCARVVIGCRDPNPRVDGGGVAVLEAAGIQVDVMDGAEGAQAQRLIADFAARITSPPFDAEAMTGAHRGALRKLANQRKADKSIAEVRVALPPGEAAPEKEGGFAPAWLAECDGQLRRAELLLLRFAVEKQQPPSAAGGGGGGGGDDADADAEVAAALSPKKAAKAAGAQVAQLLGASVAQVLGHTVLLYRPANPPKIDLAGLGPED